MVRFVFGVEDLARMRFALSPMNELVSSLLALRDPSTAAPHVPWLRSLNGRLDGLELEPAVALIHMYGYQPDFINPPPSGPVAAIEDDLAALRATPVSRIRDEMELFRSQHPRSKVTAAWLAHPRREVTQLARTLAAYWERALAPVWPRVRELLEADIAYRARQLTTAGPAALLAELAPTVSYHDGLLDVEVMRHEAEIVLGGQGLLLMPSAFAWSRTSVTDRAPWQPTLIYPARGVATLWDEGARAPDGLRRLLGASRAGLLADLAVPRSTSELARRHELSPASTSHHLSALREAGLVSGRRDGRFVLYRRTPLGDALSAG